MSVSDRRRSQSTSHVSMRPDQLREMIGDVVRESLQQAGVGNILELDRVTLPSMRVIRYRNEEDIPSLSHSINISISHSLSQLERGISIRQVIQISVRV